ncbi:MAG: hypothetical protein FJ335_11450 [Sphingomonadales bacterium]|nr:hypothetical protein [Sphingomonadales bacterium]
MKGFWIDERGVSEIDVDPDWTARSSITWDAVPLGDGHTVWVDDMGLFRPNPLIATIGTQRLPLPALVLGREGERSADVTMGMEQLCAAVTLATPPARDS